MELLEKYFETAFSAPDGIKRLRELILTLAMQGKLVPQDPNDQPASELLKEIKAEKARLVKEGKIKESKPLPEIRPDEVPYQLPESWEWVRLGEISTYIQRGKGPSYSEVREIPVISQKCIQWSGFDKDVVRFVDPSTLASYHSERFVRTDDLLWNSTGTGTIGRISIYKDELSEYSKIVADSHVTIVRLSGVCKEFMLNFLISPAVQDNIESDASGTTNQVELNTATVTNWVVPLPPPAAQHRIVEKIDQLMARCDELKRLRMDRDEKRLAVHAAALKSLLGAKENATFDGAWDFITRHFGELYSVRENVAELRKTILQLAVMGKLVPQDPNDQPASELLKEIKADKARLVKAGTIRASKPLPEISPDEVPYQLPKGWEWVRFFTVNSIRTKHVSAREFPEEKQIAPDSIEKGNGRLLFHRTVSESGAISVNNRFYRGQILYSKIRPSLNKVVIAPYDGLCSADMYPIDTYVDTEFMLRVMLSETILVQVRLVQNRVKMPKLNSESLGRFCIPIPPLAEQHRIVAKIEQLMALCGALEEQIDSAAAKQNALLDAVMGQV